MHSLYGGCAICSTIFIYVIFLTLCATFTLPTITIFSISSLLSAQSTVPDPFSGLFTGGTPSSPTQLAWPPPQDTTPSTSHPHNPPDIFAATPLDNKHTKDDGDSKLAAAAGSPAHQSSACPTLPPPTATPLMCVALSKYESTEPGDLQLLAGDIIRVHNADGDWWEGMNERTNEKGLFPSNFVREHKVCVCINRCGAISLLPPSSNWLGPKCRF